MGRRLLALLPAAAKESRLSDVVTSPQQLGLSTETVWRNPPPHATGDVWGVGVFWKRGVLAECWRKFCLNNELVQLVREGWTRARMASTFLTNASCPHRNRAGHTWCNSQQRRANTTTPADIARLCKGRQTKHMQTGKRARRNASCAHLLDLELVLRRLHLLQLCQQRHHCRRRGRVGRRPCHSWRRTCGLATGDKCAFVGHRKQRGREHTTRLKRRLKGRRGRSRLELKANQTVRKGSRQSVRARPGACGARSRPLGTESAHSTLAVLGQIGQQGE